MEYKEMFDRNLGVWSLDDQEKLRKSSVAIIGCGGMGGVSAQIVARSGIENLIVADPDKYEQVNINNQFNAFEDTIGKNKAETVGKCLKQINPNINASVYPEGLTDKNVDEIVSQADIVLDCVDYNELYYSYILSASARKKGIFVMAPQAVGYGGSVLIFDPNGMSFNEYLGLDDNLTEAAFQTIIAPPEKYAAIIPSYIDQKIIKQVVNKEIPIPNVALAQTLAASIMVAEAIFVLLGKRKPVVVPKMIAVDLLDKKQVT